MAVLAAAPAEAQQHLPLRTAKPARQTAAHTLAHGSSRARHDALCPPSALTQRTGTPAGRIRNPGALRYHVLTRLRSQGAPVERCDERMMSGSLTTASIRPRSTVGSGNGAEPAALPTDLQIGRNNRCEECKDFMRHAETQARSILHGTFPYPSAESSVRRRCSSIANRSVMPAM